MRYSYYEPSVPVHGSKIDLREVKAQYDQYYKQTYGHYPDEQPTYDHSTYEHPPELSNSIFEGGPHWVDALIFLIIVYVVYLITRKQENCYGR